MTQTIDEVLARWDSGEGKPYKGSLIDWRAYEADNASIGCMCAQGQVLHLVAGWSPERLYTTNQPEADKETAKLLGISIAHSILLRSVNDKVDGAPSIVLTHPEKILGDQAHIVLAFWRHLDRMTGEQWTAAGVAAEAAAWVASAGAAAWVTAQAAAEAAAWVASAGSAGVTAQAAAEAAEWVAAGSAAGSAQAAAEAAAWVAAGSARASHEIQGAALMRERGQAFYFLPMFGFADPEAVLAADQVPS